MRFATTIILFIASVTFWGCIEESSFEVNQMELDEPNSPPTIHSTILTEGNDFSVGYYNGNIRTDRVKLEWDASTDENFLGYKIFRAAGGYGGDITEGFESGSFPSGWTEYGDYGGWYVTNEDAYEGSYSLRSYSGDYGWEYLEKTITVPQYADVFISFWSKGIDDGDGYLYLNGNQYVHWGYDYYGADWQYFSTYYYTGTNTQITLQWLYSTESYGHGILDNIVVSGTAGENPSFTLIETLNDKNSTEIWDLTLTENQYYIYKVATLVETGIPKVDDIEIKTPLWQSPGNPSVNVLSPTVIELTWEDNSESETAFQIFADTLDVSVWEYVTIDSLTANKNDTNKVISGLSTSAQYRFSIKATNIWEEDTPLAYSPSITFSFNPPSNLVASQVSGTKTVNLTWYDNSTLENGLKIERKSELGDFVEIAIVDSNVTSYVDYDTTDFEYDSTYTYRVRAYNDYSGMIYTDYSDEASVTLSTGLPLGYVEIGTETSSWSYPFYTFYHDARTQILYLQSEIQYSFAITKIAFYVTTLPGQTMNNFVVRMKHTQSSYFSDSYFDNSGYTICHDGYLNINQYGWVEIILSTPFSYNGDDNLIIDISFDNTYYTSNGGCWYTSTSQPRSLTMHTDSGLGDPLNWSSGTSNYQIPNIRLYSD